MRNAYFTITSVYDLDTVLHFCTQMLQYALWQAPTLYIMWPHKCRGRSQKKNESQEADVSASESIIEGDDDDNIKSESDFAMVEGRKRSQTEKDNAVLYTQPSNTSLNSPISSIWSKAEHMKDTVMHAMFNQRSANVGFKHPSELVTSSEATM